MAPMEQVQVLVSGRNGSPRVFCNLEMTWACARACTWPSTSLATAGIVMCQPVLGRY